MEREADDGKPGGNRKGRGTGGRPDMAKEQGCTRPTADQLLAREQHIRQEVQQLLQVPSRPTWQDVMVHLPKATRRGSSIESGALLRSYIETSEGD